MMKTAALVMAGIATWGLAAIGAEGTGGGAGDEYRLSNTIRIGGDGGWDYLSVDGSARRLYVSHGTRVVVVDLDKEAVVGEIAPTPGVHGLAPAPDLGKGFVSDGQESKAAVVDLPSLRIVSKVETGANPDCILYEPQHKEVYTFNGRARSATVFDAVTGRVAATIPLPGKPEFAVEDLNAGRIYDNIEDASGVVAIDTGTHTVVASWPTAPGREPTGLAIDGENHRLFISCSNDMLVMMDSASGKVLSTLPIGPGADGAAFDPGTGLAFASSSDGTLTVARVESGKLVLVQKLATPLRSRTMTIDTKTHKLYVSAADFQPGAPGPDGRPGRPQMTPGSFRVMVYSLAATPAK